MRTDGKETKAIVQQTAKEAMAIMQLMADNVSEVKSASISITLTPVHTLTPITQ